MSWLKRLFAPAIFPGSGRHVHVHNMDVSTTNQPTPAEEFLDPYTAGHNWRLAHTEAEHATATEERVRTAPWTRPLIGGQDR